MKGIPLLLMVLATLPCSAQTPLSGEFRPRAEYRNGYKLLPDSCKVGLGYAHRKAHLY